ncbi:MAG: beta-ketoacyl-ACP synthase II [Phycisphaerales bacterium]|nr:beta-ketoacyl-ACP synthase II [Phycisphaerae bacterium]NNF41570.1 beta-ketoacyl-ACP synthase II [Phycisphaerales bacterium]NNM24842.1 beta-ketoacyl-ACP synthase II [Phycisphaerales bacterium]
MSSLPKRRVVVTGLGAVTNVGADVPTMWASLVAGRSGIGPITGFEQCDDWPVTIAGEVADFDPSVVVDRREAKRMDRFCLLGLFASEEAARDCGLDFTAGDPTRRGVVIGSGVGGIITIENGAQKLMTAGPRKMSPFIVPKLMVNACAGNVSIRHNLKGVNSATATACATGAHAIGTAYHLIQRGDADVMFAGGSEAAISPLCIASFAAMKALSTRNGDPTKASRPFDRDRDGFVMAEGAGIIVLEEYDHARARDAKIYAEVIGFGSSGDAQHIAAPDPEGLGAQAAMTMAIAQAGIGLEQVDYINAHGTSTPLGDAAEVYAVKNLFGADAKRLALSSTKSMTGHALGAAGGIESVVTILAVHEGTVPPTINLDQPDDGFDLDFVAHEAQSRTVRCGLNNSFGFGGHNVTLAFGPTP